MLRSFIFVFCLGFIALVTAANAGAQSGNDAPEGQATNGQAIDNKSAGGSSALRGLDTEQPIDVEADRLEVNDKDGTAKLIGNVKVVQGPMTLTTETMTIYFNRENGKETPEIYRIDALTDLKVETSSETITGSWGVYDVKKRLITLGGMVDLIRTDATLKGSLLQINLIDGVTTLDRAPLDTGASGRVKGRFLAPPARQN